MELLFNDKIIINDDNSNENNNSNNNISSNSKTGNENIVNKRI